MATALREEEDMDVDEPPLKGNEIKNSKWEYW